MGVCRFVVPDSPFKECGRDSLDDGFCRDHQPDKMVNHPVHYGGDVPHEVYKCLAAWGLTDNAYLWNAVKYIARAGKKPYY